jgi:hypothetical protein
VAEAGYVPDLSPRKPPERNDAANPAIRLPVADEVIEIAMLFAAVHESVVGPQLIFQSGQRNVCFERNSGKYLLVVSFSAHEPRAEVTPTGLLSFAHVRS